jgi:hypothetical protein
MMYTLWRLFSLGVWEDKDNAVIYGANYKVLNLLPKKQFGTYNRIHQLRFWIVNTFQSYCVKTNMIINGFDIADLNNTLTIEVDTNNLSDALYWIEQSKVYKNKETPIYLIGLGKSGNEFSSPYVTKPDVIQYCQENNIHYYEVRRESHIQDIIMVLRHFLTFRLESNSSPKSHQISTKTSISQDLN